MSLQRPAVFFDRDGVLNIDHGYTYRKEEFQWMPGAIEAIRHFNLKGYYVFVVTNQSGIARGYYTEEDVKKLHSFMNEELAKQSAYIDEFYFCPHHVEGKIEEFRQDCQCRKPMPGMLLQAAKKWSIDLAKSFMIGDRPSDTEAAKSAGIKGYLFSGNNLYEYIKTISD